MKGKTGKAKHHMDGPKKGLVVIIGKPKKHGGKVEGHKPHTRADKKARGGATEPKKWMQDLDIKKGAMTTAAKREGVSNAKYEQEHKHDSGKAGKRARLALTFKHSKH